ncbi:uncharacterized protein LOC124341396 [Daphnia pulicaria]|uniref:uncharacterized protein LOC124341396 n=1 Tax=Daphnia pulicaria TaxID=35523 RepID=UPI001EEA5CBF|nr:uncharacterized protein LOC124341396 [Daphnia pulicaria]
MVKLAVVGQGGRLSIRKTCVRHHRCWPRSVVCCSTRPMSSSLFECQAAGVLAELVRENEPSSSEMSSGLMKSIKGNPLTAVVEDLTVDELGLGYDVESDGDESGRGFLVQSAVHFCHDAKRIHESTLVPLSQVPDGGRCRCLFRLCQSLPTGS